MHKILKSYLRRLTNLTGNNKSLVLLRLVATQFADLHAFDFASGQTSFSVIQDLIERKSKITLCPVVDSRDENSNKLSASLKKINRTNNFIYEESGSKDLYVGWPFVQGKLMDGTAIRCPLLFFPVELISDEKNWYLKQREEVNITLNKSFLLAYSHFNDVKIDDDLVERVFEDFDTDSTVFRTSLYQLFKESPVEINFNSENFADQLRSFREYKKPDFEQAEKKMES